MKVTILLLLLWAIYRQLFQQRNFNELWLNFKTQISPNSIYFIIAALLLLPINLGIETIKWQKLISKFYKLPFFNAFKAIVLGNTMALFTPNRVGEYIGRVLYVPQNKIVETVSATMVGGLSQLIITLLVGLPALILLQLQLNSGFIENYKMTLGFTIVVGAITSVFYFKLNWLVVNIKRLNYFKKWLSKIEVVKQFNAFELLQVLCLSLFKYLIFTAQFLLLLYAFGLNYSQGNIIAFIAVTFLIQTIIPSITLLELGVRGNVALMVFGWIGENELTILLATTVLWMINLMLPALLGSIILIKKKIVE